MDSNTIEWRLQFLTLFPEGKFSLSTIFFSKSNLYFRGKV